MSSFRFITFLVAFCAVPSYLLGSEVITPPYLVAADSDSAYHDIEYFPVGRTSLRVGDGLQRFASSVDSLFIGGQLSHIHIEGSASPEGPAPNNVRLAEGRAASLKRYLQDGIAYPDSLFTVAVIGNNWDGFAELVPQALPPSQARAVLEIVASDLGHDRKVALLRGLDGGRIWTALAARVLPLLRYARATATATDGQVLDTGVITAVEDVRAEVAVAEKSPVMTADAADSVSVSEDSFSRHIYIKTNMPAWVMLWTNVAGEIDCAPHWSAAMSVYYSGFNYFTGCVKFRTLTLMPEARYWFRRSNSGFFVGAHAGVAWYNVAFGGDRRYQDHDGNTPALGGGLNAGFRFNLRNPRWKIEVSVGAGVYRLDYDVFRNHHNGLMTDRVRRTFFGVDNAAVSICYTFGIKGKGGRR